MKHTQGEWKLQHEFDNEPSYIYCGAKHVATINPIGDDLEGYANAQLLMAAPDLLEACLDASEALWTGKRNKRMLAFKKVEKAIAKAKGETA